MTTMYDVPADALIAALADDLSDRLEEPEWMTYTTTGTDRELPPEQEDFWARRGASLLRKVADRQPIGVERLSTEYGGPKHGTTRYRVSGTHREDGSKNIIRTLLQQLEDEGYIETRDGEGRAATAEGRSFLDDTAGEVLADLDRPELEKYA